MRLALFLGILPALAFAGPVQDASFESPAFGVRLKIPAGWTVQSSTPPEILKISLPGKHAISPEIAVHNLAFVEEHITIGQYREQIRQYIQRSYRDPRILDDRSVTVGGKPGVVFTTTSKSNKGDTPAISLKGLVEISPSRLLSVELVAPREMEETARKAYESLLASIEFFPRQAPDGTPEGVKKFAEALAKLPATEAGFERKFDLEYGIGDRKVGSYELSLKAGTRDGAAGIEVSSADIIDLGTDGRMEKRVTAFVSDDLSKQRAAVEIVHRGKEQIIQYFTASVTLDGTEAAIERRVNGEKSTVALKGPERTVLMELLETVEFRLLAAGKGPTLSVPVLPSFDNEAGTVKVEHTGESEMKAPGAGVVKVNILMVAREDGALISYWYDGDRKLIRRSVGGQSVILQAKK
jgi:hypothetical protein